MEPDQERVFTVKAVVTVAFVAAYIGVLVWAAIHGKLDLPSFISGVGPGVGMLLTGWFGTK